MAYHHAPCLLIGGKTKLIDSGFERGKSTSSSRSEIKFVDLGFERWQVVRFRKARGRQDAP